MNYELAKQLKEAGFPLKCTTYTTDDFVFGVAIKGEEKIMYPLLSELIEACSNRQYFVLMKRGDIWTTGIGREEKGAARLWLAINEKKS